MSNNPKTISKKEWAEIVQMRVVKESWGLFTKDDRDNAHKHIYGCKFNFVSGGPGWCGDLFVLIGDALDSGMSLIVYRGSDGRLKTI